MTRIVYMVTWAGLAVAPAPGAYWIAYEGGPGFPEQVGPWTREFGDEHGFGHGGAERRIEDGIFVLDSLRHDQIFDFYEVRRKIDPMPPFELFVGEWRVRVDEPSDPWDVGVSIVRDEPPGWFILKLAPGRIRIYTEALEFPIAPGTFHTYRFTSADMRQYELFLDGELLHRGRFDDQTFFNSRFSFGDGVQGRRSISRWDYVRFGALPDVSTSALALVAFLYLNPLVRRQG